MSSIGAITGGVNSIFAELSGAVTAPLIGLSDALGGMLAGLGSVTSSFVNGQYSDLARAARVETSLEALVEFTTLKDGWNGEGSLAPSWEALSASIALLSRMQGTVGQVELTPNESGTVSFEWETQRGYAHIEVGRTKYALTIEPDFGSPVFENGQLRDFEPGRALQDVRRVLFGAPARVTQDETVSSVRRISPSFVLA